MILFGTTTRERNAETGHFHCPACQQDSSFTLIRTSAYFHLYFIPVFPTGTVGERVQCDSCGNCYSVSILAISSAQETGAPLPDGLGRSATEQVRNIVELSDAAYDEVLQRFRASGFDSDVVVRIAPIDTEPSKVQVAFDYALTDGRDWLGQSKGIPIVIERKAAELFLGRSIDYRDGEFLLAD